MSTNDFLPFATASGANVAPQTDWINDPVVPEGFTAGILPSAQTNKALRQGTFVGAGIAQFVLNTLDVDVLDDGNLGHFTALLSQAISAVGGTGGPSGGVPEAPLDGNTYGRHSALWTTVLPMSGGTMTGPLVLNADPAAALGAATKQYVDAHVPAGGPFLPLAGGTLTGLLTLSGAPTANLHAATKLYVDTAISGIGGPYLPLAGGTLTGPLTLSGAPTTTLHATTKTYVDTADAARVPLAGGTMTGPLILNADPVNVLGAATKQYVDAHVGGAGFLPLTGGTLTGPLILAADPAAALGAATKQYVDAHVGGAGFLPLTGGTMTGTLTLAADPVGNLDAATRQFVLAQVSGYLPLTGGTLTGAVIVNAPGSLTVNAALSVGTTGSFSIANTATANSAAGTFAFNAAAVVTWPTAPASGAQLANKTYVDAGDATKVPLAGGTLTGPLILNADPAVALGAATRQYVDAHVGGAGYLPTTGGTMTGPLILAADPATALGAATKQYVDNAVPVGGPFLPLAGGTLTGLLTLSGAPTALLHATTKTYVDTADALRAPLASPALTGVPTAPTAAAGVSTTQLATTAFVGNSFLPLTGGTMTGLLTLSGAPTALLHAATKTYVDNAVAPLAPLASPAFTGIPTAPTATAGTNTTQLATTAFVNTAIGGPYLPLAGGTLTGPLTLSGAPTVNLHAATKLYVDNAVAPLAPLASPALTGIPIAPTATAGTNTTQLATTAFVGTAIAPLAPLASPALTGIPIAPTAAPGTSTTQLATTAFVGGAIGLGLSVNGYVKRTGAGVYTTEAAINLASADVTGILPTANGGTGVASGFAFNTTNGFTFNANASATPGAGAPVLAGFEAIGADGAPIYLQTLTFAGAGAFNSARSEGTGAAPLATGANVLIQALQAGGYDATNGWSGPAASITMRSANAWSATDHSTTIRFQNTSAGSVTIGQCGQFETDGTLYVGSSISLTANNTGAGTVNAATGYFQAGTNIFANLAAGQVAIGAGAGVIPTGARTLNMSQTLGLQVNLNAAATPGGAGAPGPIGIEIIGADAAATSFEALTFAANSALTAYRAEGTGAAPLSLAANIPILNMQGGGYDGSAWIGNNATIQIRSANAWSTTDHSTFIKFTTTPAGATAAVNVGGFQSDGTWYVGAGASPTTPNTGAGTVNAQNGYFINGVAAFPINLAGTAVTGILPAANGGTGVASGFTFSTIGLRINLNAVASPGGAGVPSSAGYTLLGQDASPTFFQTVTFGGAGAVNAFRSEGTGASPTPAAANILLFALQAGGYDGTNWSSAAGTVTIRSVSLWSATDHSTWIRFMNTAVGSTTITQCGAFEPDGTLYVGTVGNPALHNTGVGTVNAATGFFVNDLKQLRTVGVPATSGAAGAAGDCAYASGFLYVCVATNTWQRVALSSF